MRSMATKLDIPLFLNLEGPLDRLKNEVNACLFVGTCERTEQGTVLWLRARTCLPS